MKKLLVICGPTATGKTSLALHLAKVLKGELVSADSRQVYKGLDIGTGKNLPKDSKLKTPRPRQAKPGTVWNLAKRGGQNSKLGGYYNIKGVKIWGYDLVEPTKDFSVGQYVKYADVIIGDIRERKKLPILVGGTGLYIKGVVNGIPTASIPKNQGLRKSLKGKDAPLLFEMLATLDPTKAASMNISDKKNPRRLVRAIEIADSGIRKSKKLDKGQKNLNARFVGLTAPRKYLFGLIHKRVDARVKAGQEKEIEKLISAGVSWNSQAMSASGYKQWRLYFEGKVSRKAAVKKWKTDEKNYAKRQLAWFKHEKRVLWFDITKSDYQKSVEKLVKKWYSSR